MIKHLKAVIDSDLNSEYPYHYNLKILAIE